MASYILTRVLTPGDTLFRAGTESALVSGSLEQARIVFRFLRLELEPTGEYRFADSGTRISALHLRTRTRLRVIGSNAKTAFGIVGCPILVGDEPGAWEVNGGGLLNDAITTAQGKPGSPLKVIYIGTLAPASSGWWHDLIEGGSHGSTYVQALRGQPKRWEQWTEIKRCNPLTAVSGDFRKKLLEERDAARKDSRLKARFLSYRLNLPSADESEMVLSLEDWKLVLGRPVPPRKGRPIFAYDLGGGRAWSAAVAIWSNGRCEALAVAPGIPTLEDQERRDRVPAGLYRKLAEVGSLHVADRLRVQPPSELNTAAVIRWGVPSTVYCDRFRLAELLDAVGGRFPVIPRVARWSEASEDIRALRKIAADGPLSVAPGSRDLLSASLAVAQVRGDDQGSVRMVKRGMKNNTARDDVAAAGVLAAGGFVRSMRTRRRWSYRGAA